MQKRHSYLFLVVILLISVILSACGGQRSDSSTELVSSSDSTLAKTEMASSDHSRARNETEQALEDSASDASAGAKDSHDTGSVASHVETEDRQVIYRAQISIRVKDFDTSRAEIEHAVEQAEGYMVETSQREEERQIDGYLIARVPQDTFTDFLDEVERLADRVQNRQITGSDVTEEYVDLQSRLKAKKAVEKRLLQFMEDAEKTEDLLKISTDLGNIQEEIEQLTGKITYLQNQVAYSTVEIDITQPIIQQTVSGEKHTFAAAWSALIDSTNGVLRLLSGLVVFSARALPIMILLVIIAIPIWIWWRKKGQQFFVAKKKNSQE